MDAELRERAVSTIRANDRGGYTVPTAGLYPFQWNWDSCLAALGIARFDRDRAWREVETLLSAQWRNGMVPHIVFWADDDGYFPGKGEWDSGTEPPTSGHSQPPVASSVVWSLVRSGGAEDAGRARKVFPELLACHRWWHERRDPDGTGVVAVTHPWESGRDNSPDWDDALSAVEVPEGVRGYRRRDLDHVDAGARPTDEQYDRFMALVAFGRNCGWDPEEIHRNGPFLAADPGVQFILLRADRDLLCLAETLGEDGAAAALRGWVAAAEDGSDSLWSEDLGGYCARDLRSGKMSPGLSSASMLAWYAGVAREDRRKRMAEAARGMLEGVEYGMPSWKAGTEGFEPRRYWRGPVWAVMNFMVSAGLVEQGEADLGRRIRSDAQRLIGERGFREYFDPETGDGVGGGDFTWTAAMALAWEAEEVR